MPEKQNTLTELKCAKIEIENLNGHFHSKILLILVFYSFYWIFCCYYSVIETFGIFRISTITKFQKGEQGYFMLFKSSVDVLHFLFKQKLEIWNLRTRTMKTKKTLKFQWLGIIFTNSSFTKSILKIFLGLL